SWDGQAGQQDYSLVLEYDNLHNIKRKSQSHQKGSSEVPKNTFDQTYAYTAERPHIPSFIGAKALAFDANGNQVVTKGDSTASNYRQMLWDEENRLMTVAKNGYISRYTYDGRGERIIKSQKAVKGVFVDGNPVGRIHHSKDYTVYINPYFSATETNFTKHYFVGSTRILSKKGTGKFNNKYWFSRGLTAGGLNYVLRLQQMQASLSNYYEELGIPPGPPTLSGFYGQPEYTQNALPQPPTDQDYNNPPRGWPTPPPPADPNGPPGPPIRFGKLVTNDSVRAGFGYEGFAQFKETDQFFYHANHLRSSCYLTDFSGQVRQHLEYLPFGETFVEESNFANTQPYLFNGKELDRENDLYYYGARYYDRETGLWLSVDPLATDFPSWSPYAFTLNNPMSMVDPDGKKPGELFKSRDAAAIDFGKNYNGKSIKDKAEYAARMYRVKRNGKVYYSYGKPAMGTHDESNPHQSKVPRGKLVVGDLHTHGHWLPNYGNNEFSPADRVGIYADWDNLKNKNKKTRKYYGYVATPNGNLLRYDPATGETIVVSSSMPYDKHYEKKKKGRRLSSHTKKVKKNRPSKMRMGNSKQQNRKMTFSPAGMKTRG
ncbi:MAG: DUF4329 domain-containing protein, partial [Bacteroidota bacterium]